MQRSEHSTQEQKQCASHMRPLSVIAQSYSKRVCDVTGLAVDADVEASRRMVMSCFAHLLLRSKPLAV
jgi:hypothetical protein